MSRNAQRRIAAIAILALSAAIMPTGAAAAVTLEDVPASVLPPGGWEDTQWSDPGGWTTVTAASIGIAANTPTTDASALIESYLAGASGRVILSFPAGVFYLHTALTITRSNVIIRGAGSEATSFVIGSEADPNAEILFTGSRSGAELAVAAAVPSGAQQITLANASTIGVGDVVQLIANAGIQAFGFDVESQFFVVTAKSGNTLTVDMPVGLDYSLARQPVVQRIEAIRNVGIDNALLTRHVMPTGDTNDNLEFMFAYNAFAKNLESVMAYRTHISVYWSKDVVIAGNKVHDGFRAATGDNSYGYGIALNWGSTGVRVSDNKLWNLRHMILLQLGANHSVISYNSLENTFTDYNDLALHATYAYMNLFEGNRFKEGYADNSKAGQGALHPTGPGNTWFRNYANEEIGSINTSTVNQNIIGNVVGSIVSSGSGHTIGANVVGGSTQWGSLPVNADLPPSLYLDAAPAFWTAGRAWPSWGPDIANGGTSNRSPAQDKSKPTTITRSDWLNDWSGTHFHTSSLIFGTSNPANFGGDTSRVSRANTGTAEVIWNRTDFVSAFVTTYFWPNAAVAPFTFQVSSDGGATWQNVTPRIQNTGGDWLRYTYTVSGGGTADYLKVVFPAISPNYTGQIGAAQFIW